MAKYGREGHRGRIKQAYFEHGAEDMSGVHLVELLLDYIAVGINGYTSINDTEHFKLIEC